MADTIEKKDNIITFSFDGLKDISFNKTKVEQYARDVDVYDELVEVEESAEFTDEEKRGLLMTLSKKRVAKLYRNIFGSSWEKVKEHATKKCGFVDENYVNKIVEYAAGKKN